MFKNTYIDGYIIDDPIVLDIYSVVSHIKSKQFDLAIKIMKSKDINFEKIFSKTQKLKLENLIDFVDYLIKK